MGDNIGWDALILFGTFAGGAIGIAAAWIGIGKLKHRVQRKRKGN